MIEFNEELHRYTENGVVLPSVSQVLRAVFGNKYDCVNQDILEKAQNKGNAVHTEIQNYESNGELGFSKELEAYIRERSQDLEYINHEQIIGGSEFKVCGKYDLLFNGILADIKTNSKFDKDYVQKQLSLYKYIGKFKEDLMAIWLKDNVCKFYEIDYLGDEWCQDVINKYYAGETYESQEIEIYTDALALECANVFEQIEALENRAKQIKDELKSIMEKKGIQRAWFANYNVSYVSQTKRESLDTKKLALEMPEVYNQYLKTSNIASSIRITKKGE